MKLPLPISDGRSPAGIRGFTLPEILIALTIFLFLVIAIVFANIFGLSMFQMNSTRLNVSRWSRETVERFTDEVHACTGVQVGYMTNSGPNNFFAAPLLGEPQQGDALQIQTSTNTSIIYFVNSGTQTFVRMDLTNQLVIQTVTLADSVTNTTPFSAEDFAGNVLSNNISNPVIHFTLEFYQPQLYLQDADYYKLDTAVSQRSP
jgi:prepilin-type N-terminal cleavage/methylation domain-containing protein